MERDSKRRKIAFEGNDYARGSIKKIYLKNFMTYKEATLIPGPKLNMVLGPNGSGKSSVVCSICIGLNGKTTLLGRANSLKEFVRKGEDSALVRINISGGPGRDDIVFERVLKAHDNTSSWRINGVHRTEKQVAEETHKLNIQLDNLCQFLPQEKVGEFAKMTPTELLKNTERAIGDAALLRMHERLISGSEELSVLENELAGVTRQLATLKDKKEGMAREVKRIQERERLLQEAGQLRARAAWLRVERDLATLDEAKAASKEQSGKVAKLEASLRKKTGPLEEKSRAVNGPIKAKMDRLNEAGKKLERSNEALVDYFEGVDLQFDAVHNDLKQCDDDESKRQRELKAARDVLSLADDEIAAIEQTPDPVDPDEERRVMAERSRLSALLGDLTSRRQELLAHQTDAARAVDDAKKRLHELRQISHQRLQALDRQCRGIGRFAGLIHEMKRDNKFQGNVYGPIATEINMVVDTPAAANALEGAIKNASFQSFVVEHRADQDLINRAAADVNFTRCNTVCYTSNPNEPLLHRNQTAAHWAHLGVTHTLDELFDAPMTVKHVLNDQSNICSVFMADGDDKVTPIFHETPVRQVYTEHTFNMKVVSRYNRNGDSFRTSGVKPAMLLSERVDKQQVERQEERRRKAEETLQTLQPQLEELDARKIEADRELKQVNEQLNKWKGARAAHKKLREKLRLRRVTVVNKISELEKRAPLAKKVGHNKKLTALKAELAKNVKTVVRNAEEQFRLQMELAVAVAEKARCQEAIAALEQALQAERQELVQVKQAAAAARAALDAATTRYDAALKRAQELLPRSDATAAQHEALQALSEDSEECQLKAATLEDQANAIAVADPGAIERYQDLESSVAALEAQNTQLTTSVNENKGALEDARLKWLPELKEKVVAISAKFSENFRRIGSVGEVGLREDGENFANYAIEIRVKFRDEEELEVLDAHRQSGGERSVSTIMYLLSLQNITQTPLRVVDEINQGMDNTNERRVFQAMVDAATEETTPQCLLMTPKLLPQLQYSQHVNVLQIYNGPLCSGPADKYSPADVLSTLIGR